MIFFGHIGLSLAGGNWLAGERLNGWTPLLALAFCAYLPDLIDKPLFWLGLAPDGTGRLYGHTLFFSAAAVLAARLWLPVLWPWVWAVPGHLALDRIWETPQTLFWPLLGNHFAVLLPPGVTHLQPAEFLAWKMADHPWWLALDLTAEVVGLALTWTLVKRLWPGRPAVLPGLQPPAPVIETPKPR